MLLTSKAPEERIHCQWGKILALGATGVHRGRTRRPRVLREFEAAIIRFVKDGVECSFCGWAK